MNLYGRTFRLLEGNIALQGPAEATTLDVTAQYQVPTQGDPDDEDVLINVEAKGRPDSLDLDFSVGAVDAGGGHHLLHRDRPAGLGQPAGGPAGRGRGVTRRSSRSTSWRRTSAAPPGEELGFDVFQIRQEPARGLTLTAGRYLASRVFVSLQQPLRIGATAEQQAGGATGPGFELEYTLQPLAPGYAARAAACRPACCLRGRYAF